MHDSQNLNTNNNNNETTILILQGTNFSPPKTFTYLKNGRDVWLRYQRTRFRVSLAGWGCLQGSRAVSPKATVTATSGPGRGGEE